MFKSKLRPIAIPQSEHQKLAGTLALLWGNAAFDFPPVPLAAFVTGIGLHDRAYGQLDNLPIGELPEQEWLVLTRKGFDMAWSDPLTDAIAKMHLQRLTSYGRSPARQAEAAAMGQTITTFATEHGLDTALLARIDRITRLCDDIAFTFCFEVPAEGAVSILPSNDQDSEVAVHYRVEAGRIEVDPWPFGVNSYRGYLEGYRLEGYPYRLEPVIVPYSLLPRPT